MILSEALGCPEVSPSEGKVLFSINGPIWVCSKGQGGAEIEVKYDWRDREPFLVKQLRTSLRGDENALHQRPIGNYGKIFIML